MTNKSFRLSDHHDVEALGAVYRAQGRVRIRGFLTDAGPLTSHLAARDDWRQVINAGDKVYELDRATRAGMDEGRMQALDAAVYAGAAADFQFRYESIRVADEEKARRAAGDLLNSFATWLSQGEARGFLRAVTGEGRIDFADAQATSFAAGDFLTAHDDEVPGKQRHAAYVFGMTSGWRAEWGGLLLFHEGEDALSGAVPSFNVLDVFAVPQPHSVSLVGPAATGRRLSVTGWLRSK